MQSVYYKPFIELPIDFLYLSPDWYSMKYIEIINSTLSVERIDDEYIMKLFSLDTETWD